MVKIIYLNFIKNSLNNFWKCQYFLLIWLWTFLRISNQTWQGLSKVLVWVANFFSFYHWTYASFRYITSFFHNQLSFFLVYFLRDHFLGKCIYMNWLIYKIIDKKTFMYTLFIFMRIGLFSIFPMHMAPLLFDVRDWL